MTPPAALKPEWAISSGPLVPVGSVGLPRGAERRPEVSSQCPTPILHDRNSMAKTYRFPSLGSSCPCAAGHTRTDTQADAHAVGSSETDEDPRLREKRGSLLRGGCSNRWFCGLVPRNLYFLNQELLPKNSAITSLHHQACI